jgi:hypothetical protein
MSKTINRLHVMTAEEINLVHLAKEIVYALKHDYRTIKDTNENSHVKDCIILTEKKERESDVQIVLLIKSTSVVFFLAFFRSRDIQ